MSAPYFFLTAAEHSGDALGAKLIAALKQRYPDARFVGVGGPEMAAAGCALLANPVKGSAMLAGAFLTHSWYWWKLLRRIRRELAGRGQTPAKPDVVIPIDSSVINLRIAAAAKRLGLKVCYYVAPQIWASRPWRIKKLRGAIDTLCCMLPFEEQYFTERGVNAVYVGHPMFDVPLGAPTSGVLSAGGAEPPEGGTTSQSEGWTTNAPESGTPNLAPKVALFPGSRKAEIDGHMPAMLQVAQQIKGRFPKASFTAAAPSEERAWQIRHHLRSGNTPVEIRVGDGDAVIAWADVVLCKSGTTTLQIARQAKPMVVIFKVSRWQWAIAKHFITTPHIALVNILAGREIVKEFIPFHGNAAPVARECLDLISFPAEREKMQRDLQALGATMRPREGISATERVADEVAKLLAIGTQIS